MWNNEGPELISNKKSQYIVAVSARLKHNESIDSFATLSSLLDLFGKGCNTKEKQSSWQMRGAVMDAAGREEKEAVYYHFSH